MALGARICLHVCRPESTPWIHITVEERTSFYKFFSDLHTHVMGHVRQTHAKQTDIQIKKHGLRKWQVVGLR